MAECSQMEQRLIPSDNRRIFVHVKKLASGTGTKMIILVGGALGGSSSLMDGTMERLYNDMGSDFDIYSIEPRGVGRSDRVGCDRSQAETRGSVGGISITQSEFTGCKDDFSARWPRNGTEGFSVTTQARDIIDLITTERGTKDLFLYGFSFGTYLLNRVVRLNAGTIPIKGIILDSPVPFSGAENERFLAYDRDVVLNQGVNKILTACSLDPFCGEEMMSNSESGAIWKLDPVHYANSVFIKAFQNETCNDVLKNGYDQTFWKKYIAQISSHSQGRVVIPAILYRLDRCDSYDVDVLNYIASIVQSLKNAEPVAVNATSPLIERHILVSEFWGLSNVPRWDALESRFKNLLFGTGSHQVLVGTENWPVYRRDAHFNQAFTTDAPVLILSGEFDTFTPSSYADSVEKSITSPNKKKVIMPYSTHWVIQNSPVYENNVSNSDCGYQIFQSFLVDPSNVDESCLANILEIDWRGAPEANVLFIGVEDAFNGIYEPFVEPKVIGLYLFITIYTATCVIAIVTIAMLVYYIFQLCSRVKDIEEEEEEFVEQE